MARLKPSGAVAALLLGLMPACAAILDAVHPDFELQEIPLPDKYKTMGLAFLNDGRLALASIETVGMGEVPAVDSLHKILLIKGVNAGDKGPIEVREIALLWHQIAGLTVAEGKLYASDRDGFYEIEDLDHPTDLAGNRRLIVKWPDENHWKTSFSWHQWVFTPLYWKGYFYGPYSGSIQPGGWSNTDPTTKLSGAFLKWDLDGTLSAYAGGLRSPNGAALNPATGEMFVTDNQGSWLPSSTFMKIKPGKFYGHRQSSPDFDPAGAIIGTHPPNFAESLPYEPPVAWLPHGTVRSSPTQPALIPQGGYAGDWLIGDVNNPGLIRVALDSVGDNYNGAVFWFTKGLGNAAVNRMVFGPDGGLVIGTLTRIAGNWPGGDKSPLYKLMPKGPLSVFDMKSIRMVSDGVEIEFTQPVNPDSAGAEHFAVKQWRYIRQREYGQGKQDDEFKSIVSAEVSRDRKRVHLKIDSLKTDRVAYFRLTGLESSGGKALWNDEAWFTVNALSNRVWNPETTTPVEKPVAALPWMSRVRTTAGQGIVHVTIDYPGRFTATLHALDGAEVDGQTSEASNAAPGNTGLGDAGAAAGVTRMQLSRGTRGPGLYLLRVRAAGDREFLSRKIFL